MTQPIPGSRSPGSKEASEYILVGKPLSPAIQTLLAGGFDDISTRMPSQFCQILTMPRSHPLFSL